MSDATLATRELLWNQPQWFMYITYATMFVCLGIMIFGLKKKLDFVANGRPYKDLIPEKLNWEGFFKTIFLQGKVPRKPRVGAFHALIYYSFLFLAFVTSMVALQMDFGLPIFQGWFYKFCSFGADLSGFLILVGIVLAFIRRYVEKPSGLEATAPKSELFMYGMLLNLVIVGFLMEGLRISGTGMPIGERYWSPLGYFIGTIFTSFNLSDSFVQSLSSFLWLQHMVSTMAFIACIPFTKFFHIIFAPFNALITFPNQGAILSTMDFEDETAETFGLGKLSELSLKNRLDLMSCVECGRCTDVCPANNVARPLDPKTIITKARDFSELKNTDKDLWAENPLFSSNELDSCTTCGACMEECPMSIEHVNLIMEAKRYKVLTLGEIPPMMADANNKAKLNGNPWGISQDDRFKWADGLDVPVIEEKKKVKYLFYVGCAGSYDPGVQKVMKDTVGLLNKAGVDYAVMGKMEKCCGDPVRRSGDEYSFSEMAIENIADIGKYDFEKIITSCPHCMHTLGKEYQSFENWDYEVKHNSEVLSELLDEGKLTPKNQLNETVTFHDPCYLGRHHGEYSAPRNILEKIPGVQVEEMEKSKDKSRCCGMGGGNMWYELDEGAEMSDARLNDIGATNAHKAATACPFCTINLNSSKDKVDSTKDVEIKDVTSILADSCL